MKKLKLIFKNEFILYPNNTSCADGFYLNKEKTLKFIRKMGISEERKKMMTDSITYYIFNPQTKKILKMIIFKTPKSIPKEIIRAKKWKPKNLNTKEIKSKIYLETALEGDDNYKYYKG